MQSLKSRADVSKVPDIIVGYLPLSLTEKEELLETAPLKLRLRKLYEILVREQEIADVAKNISETGTPAGGAESEGILSA